ncbi:MAG: nodulation protein NfeD [Desulfobacteraceae bacterium]|nr:MAG: nodulation protein NfeD [Desulfobacteraceae bacterium]
MFKANPRSRFSLLWTVLLSICFFCFWTSPGFSQNKEVFIIDLQSDISAGTAGFLSDGIQKAQKRGSELIVILLDTPGGSVSAMQTMVKDIMNSPLPIVVYVAPKGASAASAGVLITVAAHVAAMAPGTNIGAAHPVPASLPFIPMPEENKKSVETEKTLNYFTGYARSIAQEKGRNADWVEKAIRDSASVTANEALTLKVVDLIAENLDDLLKQLDGREITVNKVKRTLQTKDLDEYSYRPSFRDKVLGYISSPMMILLLFLIGIGGIGYEIFHPGAIFPGVIGGIAIILFAYAIQFLPVNYSGLLLIALAIAFFIAEVKISSYGLLAVAGTVSFILGAIMLFKDVGGISLKFIITCAVLTGGFFMVVTALVIRTHRSKVQSGQQGLIGEKGIVKQTLDPEGVVFVHGELWKAISAEKISADEKIAVEKVNGLVLTVKRDI